MIESPSTAPRRSAAPAARDLILLVAGALVLIGAGIGLRGPWPADEPRFVLIAKEMLETGRWLIPVRAGELYPDKPPLFMWAIAGVWALVGSMRVAFLLPSLAASVGALLLVYDLGRRLWSRSVGLVAAALLLFTIQFTLQGRSAQIDMTLTFWTTLGLYGLLRHLLAGRAPGWFLAAWGAMGVGVITKGVGFLPALVLVPAAAYVLVHGRGRLRPVPAALWLLGPAVFLGAILLWVGPMLLEVARAGDPTLAAYRDEVLFGQTVDRYVAASGGHRNPPWYYLVEVAPWFWLPGTLLLPWAVPAWARRLRRGDARYWLLLGWVATVLIFFSLSPGKRGVYLLPATPAFALALAPLLPALWRRAGPHRMAWGLLVLLGTATAGAGIAGFAGMSALTRVEAEFAVRPWDGFLALGIAALALALLLRSRRGGIALAVWMACFWITYGLWGYPLLDGARSPHTLMAEVADRTGGAELAIADYREQLVLYAGQPIIHFGYHADRDAELRAIARWLGEAPDRWLLAGREDLQGHPCYAADGAPSLGRKHRREWLLLDAGAVRPCDLPATRSTLYRYVPGERPVRGEPPWSARQRSMLKSRSAPSSAPLSARITQRGPIR